MSAALLSIAMAGTEARATLADPVGVVRPFVAYSVTKIENENEIHFRAGLITDPLPWLHVSACALGTDLEGDDGGPYGWAAVEVRADL